MSNLKYTTRNASTAIAARQNFTTSGALRGQWEGEAYRVFSYAAIIASYENGAWNVNDRKYSVTTSRHQGQVRRALAY